MPGTSACSGQGRGAHDLPIEARLFIDCDLMESFVLDLDGEINPATKVHGTVAQEYLYSC